MNEESEVRLRGSELFSKESLEKLLLVTQIFSMLAIPVLLALIGYWVQKGIQEQQIKRDYVSLAISLLTPRPKEEVKTPPELVGWAIRLLNDSSPVKLSEQEVAAIQKNGLPPGDTNLLSGSASSIIADLLESLKDEKHIGGRK